MDIVLEVLNNSTNEDILSVLRSCIPLDYYIPLLDHTFSERWSFDVKRTIRKGRYHSFHKNPLHFMNGMHWFRNGLRHRDKDKPAIKYWDGKKEWYQHGKLHRDNDKPAIISNSGFYACQEWYQHGKLHRDNDKPAVIRPNGYNAWYRHGECHRDNGPAIR